MAKVKITLLPHGKGGVAISFDAELNKGPIDAAMLMCRIDRWFQLRRIRIHQNSITHGTIEHMDTGEQIATVEVTAF